MSGVLVSEKVLLALQVVALLGAADTAVGEAFPAFFRLGGGGEEDPVVASGALGDDLGFIGPPSECARGDPEVGLGGLEAEEHCVEGASLEMRENVCNPGFYRCVDGRCDVSNVVRS